MKEDVLNKIKEISLRAKESGNNNINVHLSSDVTALNQAIKTKEQADLFMKRLKALEM